MLRIVRLLDAVVVALAVFGGVSSSAAAAPPAVAATPYVSEAYTAPKKGQTNAGVKALQQRLVASRDLGSSYVTSYFGPLTEAAVKRFQRRHDRSATGKVDRATWDLLVKQTGRIPVSTGPKLAAACQVKGRVLCADKTTRTLYYLEGGKVVRTLDVRFGCSGRLATREGTFKVGWKSRNHVSSIYHTPMPYAMFFSGGQAVHYSPDFAANGYNGCSHGCVNVRNRAVITWIFDRVRVGDRVVVYRS